MNPWLILDGYGAERGVYVRCSLVKALDSVQDAYWLCQALFYQKNFADSSGWWEIQQDKICAEIGMSEKSQRTTRGNLQRLGLLEERKLQGNRLAYRLKLEAIVALLVRFSETPNGQFRNSQAAVLETPVNEFLETPNGQFYNKDLNPSLKPFSKTQQQQADLELEQTALAQLRQLSGKEKGFLNHWTDNLESKLRAYKILAVSPGIFKSVVELAGMAKASAPTFREWGRLLAQDIDQHGHERVLSCIQYTLAEVLERPSAAWKFYRRVIETPPTVSHTAPNRQQSPSSLGSGTSSQEPDPYEVLAARIAKKPKEA